MSNQTRAFRPLAPTQSISVTAASQTVNLNNTNGTRAIRICNVGMQTVFVAFDGNAASVTTSLPVPAGQTEVFTVGPDVVSYTVIAASTGSTLYSTIGEGI